MSSSDLTPRDKKLSRQYAAIFFRFAPWLIIAICCLAVRIYSVLYRSPPTNWIYSDASAYLNTSIKFLNSLPQNEFDGVWAPGTSAILAFTLNIDPTLSFATFLNLIISALIPVMISWLAMKIGGKLSGLIAFGISAFFLPHVQYACLFLSENYSIIATTAAIIFTYQFLVSSENTFSTPKLEAILYGGSWCLASLFKSQTFIIFTIFTIVNFFLCISKRDKNTARRTLLGYLLTILLLLPFFFRCGAVTSQLFCPVSNNGMVNVALGFAGDVSTLSFQGAQEGIIQGWTPPAKLFHGYNKVEHLNIKANDPLALATWVFNRIYSQPSAAVYAIFEHFFDLFNTSLSPAYSLAAPHDVMIYFQWGALILVFLPAFIALLSKRFSKPTEVEFLNISRILLFSFFLVHCLSLGEARYRLPYDAIFISYSAVFYSRFFKKNEPGNYTSRSTCQTKFMIIFSYYSLILIIGLYATSFDFLGIRKTWIHIVTQLSQNSIFCREGIDVTKDDITLCLKKVSHQPVLNLRLNPSTTYSVAFYKGLHQQGISLVYAQEESVGNVKHTEIPIYDHIYKAGFNMVKIQKITR